MDVMVADVSSAFCKMDVLVWTTIVPLRKLIVVLLFLRNFCMRHVFRHSQLLRRLSDFDE
jgi:hypothetical protein